MAEVAGGAGLDDPVAEGDGDGELAGDGDVVAVGVGVGVGAVGVGVPDGEEVGEVVADGVTEGEPEGVLLGADAWLPWAGPTRSGVCTGW